MDEPLERPGMREISYPELAAFYKALLALKEIPLAWQVTPEDTPDRHKDYLPLNLWDETTDD